MQKWIQWLEKSEIDTHIAISRDKIYIWGSEAPAPKGVALGPPIANFLIFGLRDVCSVPICHIFCPWVQFCALKGISEVPNTVFDLEIWKFGLKSVFEKNHSKQAPVNDLFL